MKVIPFIRERRFESCSHRYFFLFLFFIFQKYLAPLLCLAPDGLPKKSIARANRQRTIPCRLIMIGFPLIIKQTTLPLWFRAKPRSCTEDGVNVLHFSVHLGLFSLQPPTSIPRKIRSSGN
ncbi:hypothetical protein P175DRAFT_0108723 [Aspergillus ochraceoroseus IBT 24754]|uniref:Uncharacterized protein n=1 Tax=Aspergillus ochraceoroseus IBT 24754 TaxID=1392256 RepID=A0A2T5LM68_9EURO|nr:uncharacterized protein P175DRAFT_0108723 [Aspergillus ochraceoroseus IBT 24754]PTU17376.1 hypothetical protein P175DRAFT_0108723 [Aspergillus ochraceoroseus IBT 24754]